MRRCARCLYPDTKPDLHFDAAGVCSACRAQEKPAPEWDAVAGRLGELTAILERGRNGSGYDCIVPSSGGKDSTAQVVNLLALGARPLVVTASTCHLTEMGRANIDNLARLVTTIEVTPNRRVRAILNRAGLELVGDISYPEHVGIFTTPFRMACDLGIPLVFFGENPQRQYGGPPGTAEAREMTLRWVQEFGGMNGLRPADLVGYRGLTDADLCDYLPPARERLAAVGVTAYFLGQFLGWDSHLNAELAVANGMRQGLPCPANLWPFENLDNAQTGLHDHMMYRKFGFGRLVAQASVDIRAGRLSRQEGLALVADRDGLFPYDYAGVPADAMLDRIGLTLATLDPILARFTNKALFAGEADRRPILAC